MANPAPIITQNNDVVIVQLPFDFETLFNQPAQNPPKSGLPFGLRIRRPDGEAEPLQIAPNTSNNPMDNFPPRYRRRLKARKSVVQHIEEVNSTALRLADNGHDIYCIPCEMDLTEYGKVKKSSIKLHLQCKRHLFNVKLQEKKSRNNVPPEIKRDEILGLFKCTLCGKAISNDLHDVKRHCAGKRHQRLLLAEGDNSVELALDEAEEMLDQFESEAGGEGSAVRQLSARDHNNEFVYDVLDYVMKTNGQLSAIKHLKKLLTKWTTMKLPTLEAIRRNHLPRYLKLNPEIAKKRQEAILRRANKRKQEIIATDEITEETVHAEMDGALLHEDEMQRIELANGSVTVSSLDLEQAINAFNAGQGQIFSMSDFAIQAVSMTD